MVKNFEKKFRTLKNTIYVIGDYNKGSYNMKGKEPVIYKKFSSGYKQIFTPNLYLIGVLNFHWCKPLKTVGNLRIYKIKNIFNFIIYLLLIL